eukprot:PLAT6610.1.p1 GENE.PLAT6610.1~~PLAT6610.1.p1  ORF type:complete len:1231 (-),score=773.83 PLAT6610.1:251-3664(-)
MAVLCDEVAELEVTAKSSLYPSLLMFGALKPGDEEEEDEDDGGDDGGDEAARAARAARAAGRVSLEVQMGRMLPFFQDLSNFVDRCHSLVINIVHQLASLYHDRQKLWQSTFRHVHLLPVYRYLGRALGMLVTIDAIVEDNEAIMTAWADYKRMMQFVRAEPDRYGADAARIFKFEQLLVSLDQTVMSGATFQTCIEQDFESPLDESMDGGAVLVDVRTNKVFLDELRFCIGVLFDRASSTIGHGRETDEKASLVAVFSLYALLRRLLPAKVVPDASLYRQLWAVQKVAPIVNLYHRVVWVPGDFLLAHAPYAVRRLDPKDPTAHRIACVRTSHGSLPGYVRSLFIEVSVWLVRLETRLTPHPQDAAPAEALAAQASVVIKGVLLAYRVRSVMHTFLNLHLLHSLPMTRAHIPVLSQCVQLLKAIEAAFARKEYVIAEAMPHMLLLYAARLQAKFRALKARLETAKRFDDTRLDMLAAVTLLDSLLLAPGSASETRRIVIDLALRVVMMRGQVREDDAADVEDDLWKLQLLADWQRRMRSVCDASFLFWNEELLSPFLAHIYKQPELATTLPYLAAAWSDCTAFLTAAVHSSLVDEFVAAYQARVVAMVEEEVINRVAQDVEEDLRLHIGSTYLDHIAPPNPRRVRALGHFIDLRAFRLFNFSLSLRDRVTAHLNAAFYNLTAVALHDWRIYGEMRNLAKEKYGLDLMDVHLPSGTLGQGLDILQIMRNIHVFVSRYNYNLNTQTFIERRSDRGAKHLNSINIQSIANSIRTHGTGIMNTTVNFTYQFLAQKFYIFSQFLHDDYIKSYLSKERRWYKKHKEEVDNRYPFERAMAFNKDIRKLGVTDDGLSFLDQFRKLITEIGNALGYVRMVRSAGLHYLHGAVKYIPDLTDLPTFEKWAGTGVVAAEPDDVSDGGDAAADGGGEGAEEGKADAGVEESKSGGGGDGGAGAAASKEQPFAGAGLPEETVEAARNVDSILKNLTKNFAEGTDYFKVLVDVFQSVMLDKENRHLRNFHMIVPALAINFNEATLTAKERMHKRSKEAYFTDDGFSIGIAYILAILQQNKQFDSLHWWQSLKGKYAEERRAAEAGETKRGGRARREDLETRELTLRRLQTQQREADLLFFSFGGARIFFCV